MDSVAESVVVPWRQRLLVFAVAALALDGLLLLPLGRWWLAAPSERFHAIVPLLWLLDFALYERHRSKVRPAVAVAALLTGFALLWAGLAARAQVLGGQLAPDEPCWWLLFLASLAVLYRVLNLVLMKLVPPLREGATAWRGWGRWLRPVIALVLFAPYAFTAANMHRPKIGNRLTPKTALGLEFWNVDFTSADDGVTLRGWFIPGRSDRGNGTVVLCHGIGANRSMFLEPVRFLHDAGFNVLMFDFRGHGDSAGHTVSVGYFEARDVRGAVDALRFLSGPRVALYGFSMGGSAVLHAIEALSEVRSEGRPAVRGVVVDSTFADLATLARHQLAWLPGPLRNVVLAQVAFWTRLELGVPLSDIAPRRHSAAISPRPLLLIHGLDDSFIPSDEARLNFAAARQPKELWLVPGAEHCLAHSVLGRVYEQRVTAFLRRCTAEI